MPDFYTKKGQRIKVTTKKAKKPESTKKIEKVVKDLATRMARKDAKVFRPSAYNTTFPTAGACYDLASSIAQGDNDNNRNGNKIRILKLKVRGHLALPTTTTPANMSDTLRFILYKDKQCNGATATVAAILESADPFANYNEDNIPNNMPKRFIILHDKTYTMNATCGGWNGTNFESGTVRRAFSITKNVKIPLQYNSTTGAVTELNSNNVGFLVISEQGAMSGQLFFETHFEDSEGL